MASINSLYLLTPMTGRESGAERTTVIGTVEMRLRTFWIGLFALGPGAILTMIFYPMLDVWALLWLIIIEVAAFWLFEKRQSDGLKLRTWQGLFDKKKSNLNTFFLCGQPISVSDSKFGQIRMTAAPVTPPAADDIFEFEAPAR